MTNHKFQLFCSCTICKEQVSVQNIKRHYNRHLPTGQCKQCGADTFKNNSFCSKSCSATFNNARKDYSKIKSGPSKFVGPKQPKPRKQKTCVICDSTHTKSGKTCSTSCKSKYFSIIFRGKNGGNRNCNLPGMDCLGTPFFFDSQWEVELAKSLTGSNIFWTRPQKFILSDGRSYTPDFYLPEYDIFLDPKAHRPSHYRQSILKIEMFELEYNTKCLVISSKKNLTWGHIQTMLILNILRA